MMSKTWCQILFGEITCIPDIFFLNRRSHALSRWHSAHVLICNTVGFYTVNSFFYVGWKIISSRQNILCKKVGFYDTVVTKHSNLHRTKITFKTMSNCCFQNRGNEEALNWIFIRDISKQICPHGLWMTHNGHYFWFLEIIDPLFWVYAWPLFLLRNQKQDFLFEKVMNEEL